MAEAIRLAGDVGQPQAKPKSQNSSRPISSHVHQHCQSHFRAIFIPIFDAADQLHDLCRWTTDPIAALVRLRTAPPFTSCRLTAMINLISDVRHSWPTHPPTQPPATCVVILSCTGSRKHAGSSVGNDRPKCQSHVSSRQNFVGRVPV